MTVLELATRWAESPRILVVEPDAEAAKTINAALRRYDCKTESVSTLRAALDAIDRQRYSMILVSVDLPGCCDLVKAIQKETPSTPVLVATTGTEHWLIEMLERENVSALRPAPFQRTLRNAIAALSVTVCVMPTV